MFVQKASARLKALQRSTTIDEATKVKFAEVLKAGFMSSDESVVENSDNSDSDNDTDRRSPPIQKRKD